jgi:[ribosomal protein S5]-alanine N-acetyltransferase
LQAGGRRFESARLHRGLHRFRVRCANHRGLSRVILICVAKIDTERLRLRPLEAGDLDAWHRRIFSDPEVTRYLPVREPISRELAAERLATFVDAWKTRGFGVWALVETDSDQLVGHCGFVTPDTRDRVELIYALGQDWWGRGLATEAGAASLRHGFNVLGFGEVHGLAFPDNEPSIRVMLKLGFVFDGTTRRFGVELARYKVTAASFRASSHARIGAAGTSPL